MTTAWETTATTCPTDYNPDQLDDDLDGIGDACERASAGTGTDPRVITALAVSPNPTRAGAVIEFALESATDVRIQIFDQAGRRVRALADRAFVSGSHAVSWDGRDGLGHDVASGTYWARLRTGRGTVTEMITIIR